MGGLTRGYGASLPRILIHGGSSGMRGQQNSTLTYKSETRNAEGTSYMSIH